MRLEENQRAQFAGQAAGQWLGIRLQMMGVAMVTAVAVIAVLEHHFRTVNPGEVALKSRGMCIYKYHLSRCAFLGINT